LLQGSVVVIAVGLIVALAFSMLIAAFTTNLIDPLISRVPFNAPFPRAMQLTAIRDWLR